MNDERNPICGSCRNNDASYWCRDCRICLCDKCLKHHCSFKPNDHVNTIAEKKLVDSIGLTFTENCSKHDRVNNLHCPTHDEIVCITCAQTTHNGCIPAVPISEVAREIKSSTRISVLEQDIDGARKILKQQIKARLLNKINLEKEKVDIYKLMKATRQLIDEKLDQLEEKISNDLTMKYEKCNAEIEYFTEILAQQQKEYEDILEKVGILKTYATNEETFIGSWQLNKTLLQKNQALSSLSKGIHEISLKLVRDQDFLSLCESLKSFGDIEIDRVAQEPLELSCNSQQCPLEESIKFMSEYSLHRKIEIRTEIRPIGLPNDTFFKSVILSCAILEDKIIFMDHNHKRLIITTTSGAHVGITKLKDKPFDVTAIPSRLHPKFAVSFPWSNRRRVDIMSMKSESPEQSIGFKNKCFGLTYGDGRLFVIEKDNGVIVMTLTGTILSVLPILQAGMYYIHLNGKQLFISDEHNNRVLSYDTKGNQIWKFQDPDLKSPRALTSDNQGHIFVSSFGTNKIACIGNNGSAMKEFMGLSEGINSPTGVAYNRDHNSFVSCNCTNGQAFYIENLEEIDF